VLSRHATDVLANLCALF